MTKTHGLWATDGLIEIDTSDVSLELTNTRASWPDDSLHIIMTEYRGPRPARSDGLVDAAEEDLTDLRISDDQLTQTTTFGVAIVDGGDSFPSTCGQLANLCLTNGKSLIILAKSAPSDSIELWLSSPPRHQASYNIVVYPPVTPQEALRRVLTQQAVLAERSKYSLADHRSEVQHLSGSTVPLP